MSYIFISYSHSKIDEPLVIKLREWLDSHRYEYWWDDQLDSEVSYYKALTEKVNGASCVIVIWTSNSVQSDFVLDEAGRARKAGRLVPIAAKTFDVAEILVGFGSFHVIRFDQMDKLAGRLSKLGIEPQSITSQSPRSAPTIGEIFAQMKRKLQLRVGLGTVTALVAIALAVAFQGLALTILVLAGILIAAILMLTS